MAIKPNRDTELSLWLARIIDDLDPEDFSISELIEEFGAASGTALGNQEGNSERYIRGTFAALLNLKYVEKIAKGRYQVTKSGENFRDTTPIHN